MAEARGPGKRIDGGGLQINGRYARVYCIVEPLLVDAFGIPLTNPGTYDSAGQYLHIRYHGNLNLAARSSGNQIPQTGRPLDFVDNAIDVEFDGQSAFTLPFEGYCELVGGKGQWKFGWYVLDYTDPRDYRLDHHWLSTFAPARSTFKVPSFHTYIMSADPAAEVILPTGNTLVPGNSIPGQTIQSGIPLIVGPNDNTLKTGWKG